MEWLTKLSLIKQISIYATAVSTVIAASFAVGSVMQAGETHWLATRGFVRDTVKIAVDDSVRRDEERDKKVDQLFGKIEHRQARGELTTLRGQRDAIKSKIGDRELLLQQDGPEAYKKLIRDQIVDYTDQWRRLEQRIEALQKELKEER